MNLLSRFLSCLAVSLTLLPVAGLAEIPISGRVLGPDGQGLEGIRVGLEPTHSWFETFDALLDRDVGPVAGVEAATDAEGYFELLAPSFGSWKVVVPWGDDGEITSRAPDYVAQEYPLTVFQAAEMPPVVLSPASVLEIKVVDEKGAPADARVGLFDRRRGQDRWRKHWRLARTGADGLVRLPWSAEERPWLDVLGPSHPRVVLTGDEFVVKDGSVELRLPPDGVAGIVRVTGPGGRGVAGAVAFYSVGGLPLGRTDEDGRLRIVAAPPETESPDGVPSGIHFLTQDGYHGYFEPRFVPGEANEVTVAVERPRRLTGQVVDLVSREPVAGALVWIPKVATVVTDRHGNYELIRPSSSYVRVRALASGYGQALEGQGLDGADSEDGPTVALPPAATVRGRVVDSEDRPISGVDVTAVPIDRSLPFHFEAFRERNPTTRSIRSGRFYLSGLPPSTSYELRFRKEGFAPTEHRVEKLEAFEDRSGLRVVLGLGFSGEGRVVDGQEAPVAGAEVRLVPVKPRSRFVFDMTSEADEDPIAAHTDPEGRFRLSHLAAGRYNLEVEASGFASVTVPGFTVAAEPGGTDFGTVVLAPGAWIEGVVRDPEGSPVAQAEVFFDEEPVLMSLDEPEPLTRSDAEGRFTLRDLRAGERYSLVVAKLGYGSETASAVAKVSGTAPSEEIGEENTVEVVLRPAGTVSGHVRDEDGDPVAGAYVEVGVRSVSADEEGAFRLENVGPGAVFFSVYRQGYQRYELEELEVPAQGEVSGLEIVLLHGATIVGTVTRADGTPVAETWVRYSPAGESLLGSYRDLSKTDSVGRFRLEDAAQGPAVIRAQLGDHLKVSKKVELRPGTQTVDLVFEEGFEISGRVSDEEGRPVAGAALTLTAPKEGDIRDFLHSSPPVTTGPDGTFTLTAAAGHYLLTAAKEGYVQAVTPEPFEVGRGPAVVIDLELERGATLSGSILGLELDDLAKVEVRAFGGSASGGDAQGIVEGIVDHEGRYSVPNLGPGQWTVIAGIEESGRLTGPRRVNVEEGATEVELDLEFKTGHTVTGVVTSGGQPKSGVWVQAVGMATGAVGIADAGLGVSETGSDGRFRLSDLPAGKYLLMEASLAPRQFWEIEVPTEEDVVIDLGAIQISGFVRDEVGERPMPGAAVRLERVDPEASDPFSGFVLSSGVETDSQGYFSLNADPGTWRVTATKAGYSPVEITVDVAGGAYDDLELRLSPTDGISFDVITESGIVPPRVLSAVLDPSGRPISQGYVPVGEGGAVHLSTVPAGTWELLVQAGDSAFFGDSAVVRVPITAPGHVGQVRLPQGAILRIKVPALAEERRTFSLADLFTLEIFTAEPQAQVRLTGPGGRPHSMLERHRTVSPQWPMWNGEATISRLAPGAWRFTIEHPDGRSWSGEATVAAGETSEIVVP